MERLLIFLIPHRPKAVVVDDFGRSVAMATLGKSGYKLHHPTPAPAKPPRKNERSIDVAIEANRKEESSDLPAPAETDV